MLIDWPFKRMMPDSPNLLVATGLSKTYAQTSRWIRRPAIKAVHNVDISLPRGKTVALVGRSGSGKTALATCLALVDEPDTGEIIFEGNRVKTLNRAERRALRRKVQVIFQHSAYALSPRLNTVELVEEPLRILACMPASERFTIASGLLEQVGLEPILYRRHPHELSGGQQQRVAIARSLALSPSLLILDEPFVGLDASIRNQIVNLLVRLQEERNLTYLYISHDMNVVNFFADFTFAMEHGTLTAAHDCAPACA